MAHYTSLMNHIYADDAVTPRLSRAVFAQKLEVLAATEKLVVTFTQNIWGSWDVSESIQGVVTNQGPFDITENACRFIEAKVLLAGGKTEWK